MMVDIACELRTCRGKNVARCFQPVHVGYATVDLQIQNGVSYVHGLEGPCHILATAHAKFWSGVVAFLVTIPTRESTQLTMYTVGIQGHEAPRTLSEESTAPW